MSAQEAAETDLRIRIFPAARPSSTVSSSERLYQLIVELIVKIHLGGEQRCEKKTAEELDVGSGKGVCLRKMSSC